MQGKQQPFHHLFPDRRSNEYIKYWTNPACILKLTNNGDGDLKIMVQHPQWLVMNQATQGVGNGLDSADSYTIHKSIDSSTAAYEWIELGHGLGTAAITSAGGSASSQEIKLPFAFPYYGKNYQSLFINWKGNVTLTKRSFPIYSLPTVPSPLTPNGVICTINHPVGNGYDWNTGKYLGKIYYYTDNEKMVVEFYDMYGGSFFDDGHLTFETIFYKDGRIKMLYQSGEFTAIIPRILWWESKMKTEQMVHWLITKPFGIKTKV